MKKRLLALLLCLVMVIGLVPTVFADEPTQTEKTTVHFDVHGGSPVDNVEIDREAPVGVVTDPTRAGFTFAGWYTDANYSSKEAWNVQWWKTPNQADFWLHAKWVENTYNIVFERGSVAGKTITGEMPTCPNVKYDKPFKLPENKFVCEGYNFAGWQVAEGHELIHDGDFVENLSTENNATVTLTAQWAKDVEKHTITLKSGVDGEINYTAEVDDGTDYTVPAYATVKADKNWSKDAASFSHWITSDGIPVKSSIPNVKADITLTAVYSAELFDITYKDADHDGSEMKAPAEDGEYVYIDPKGGEARLGSTVIKTAGLYKIAGDVTLVEPTDSSGWTINTNKAHTTFTVVWPSTKTVTISYLDYYYGADTETIKYGGSIIVDPNGGSVVWERTTISSKQTIDYIRTDAALARATRNGYTFYGWVVSYTSDRTPVFTAAWSKDYYYNTYSIYYYDYDDCKSEYANFPYGTSVVIDPNGGTAKLSGTSFSTKQYFNIYRDYTLTDASRSGYTFYGWDLTKSGSTYYFTAMWSRYKSDVPYMLNGTDHYAYIKGYPNGSFKPTDTITRAEAATIFYRLLTDSTRKAYATTYNSFKDVPATAWYNTAVSTMAKLGIVNGGADGYFRPNDPITRAEIAAMIARCDGAYYTGTSTVFSDTYGHWAAGYIDRAYELGWINGYGTTYAPDRYISRAETVAVLNRVLNRAPQYTSDLTRNYTTFSDVATSAWYYLDVEEAANSHTYTRKSNADYETWTKLIADPSWF